LYDGKIKGKVCLVTGASRGIGAAIARALAYQGANVAINYCSSRKEAISLKNELILSGVKAIAIKADVGNKIEVDKMFDIIEDELGKVNILVNNAGISLRALVTETTEEQWERVINTNLKGAFLCSRRALPAMITNKAGRIINISSVWGLYGASYEAIYATAKGGLISFSQSLAREVGPSGITVNAIAPGAIDTEMLSQELDTDEMNSLIEEIPVGRLGKSEEVAAACIYLASDTSSYINGQVLRLDGGWKA